MNATNQNLASQQKGVQTGTRILVGTSLNAKTASELLSWAIDIAACPGDTIIVLHVLATKANKKQQCITDEKKMLRRAKTFVITMIAEFAELYQAKQVQVEAKVICSCEIGKGLVDEATSTQAAFLIVGRSKIQRPSFGISTYCYLHAPDGCSVIAVQKKQKLPVSLSLTCPILDSDTGSACTEAAKFQKMNLKGQNKDASKPASPYKSDHRNTMNRDTAYCKNDEQCNHRSSTVIATNDDEIGPHDKALVTGEANFAAKSFSTLGSIPTSDSRRHNQLNTWKHHSPSKVFSFPFFHNSSRKVEKLKLMESGSESLKPTWKCFSYDEIFYATNNFHPDNLVGRGGYAEVYRGQLHDGQIIAVKSLTKNNADEKKEREFLIELGIMGHVRHPNATSLIGCCIEKGLHLMFVFSPNGNLESMLHGQDSKLLEWSVRFKIAVGVARGLHYLHECCKRRIIHRDIKASNILLGQDFEPQISDFGLAKWLPKQCSHHSVTPIEGTFGYLAPEYFMHGIVDEKTDVFSFGILLLEIVSGRKPIDLSKQNLLQWAKPFMEARKNTALADPKLGSLYDADQMNRLVLAASLCVRDSAAQRPSISEVIKIMADGSHPQNG